MSNPALQPPPFTRPAVGRGGLVEDELWKRYYLALQAGLNTGSAPANARYWVSESDGTLTNEKNIGALASGYVTVTVAAGSATPHTTATIPTSDLSGSIASSSLTGALPAISGAALTGLTGPQIANAVVSKVFGDSPYAVIATDCTILVDATGGAVTVTLPATATSGRVIIVKKTDASANAVTIGGNGHNIDGAATQALAARWNTKAVQGDGTNWFIVATV